MVLCVYTVCLSWVFYFILFNSAFYYGYLMYQCNSVKDANWPLGVISQHTLHNIKLASETRRGLVRYYRNGSGALFLKSYCPVRVLQVLPTLALSCESPLAVQPLVPAVGAAESRPHRRVARSVLCWQHPRSVPATQAKQDLHTGLLCHIRLHYTLYHKTDRWAIQC